MLPQVALEEIDLFCVSRAQSLFFFDLWHLHCPDGFLSPLQVTHTHPPHIIPWYIP